MSYTQIIFDIAEYYPSNFDFSGYSFEIISDETKFNGIIFYEQKNSIKDRIDVKTDIIYFLKAMYEGELVGIANLKIPNSVFYKKTKSLSFPKLKLTMSESTKKRLFKNKIIKENQKSISVDLNLTFNYIEKQILYKTAYKTYLNPQISNRSQFSTISTGKKKSPRRSPVPSQKSLIQFKKQSHLTTPKKYKVKSAHHSANTSINDLNSTDSEISIIDSVLIDNEYTGENEREVEEKDLEGIKSQLTLTTNCPVDSQLPDTISKQKEQLLTMQLAYQKKIENLIEIHDKLVDSYKNYNDKLRNLKKKQHKLVESKAKYEIKNNMTTNYNRKNDKHINDLIKIKKEENSMLTLIMKYFDSNNKDLTKKDNEKKLLLNVLKKALDLKVDLSSCFNKEGIAKFKTICEKYHLIDNLNVNQIQEEEEDNDSKEN